MESARGWVYVRRVSENLRGLSVLVVWLLVTNLPEFIQLGYFLELDSVRSRVEVNVPTNVSSF